jgi:hypothetical protein
MTPARLLIATPVRGAEIWSTHVTVGYSESVRALAQEMPVETIPANMFFACDNIRARNRIVAIVLRDFPHVTHVLFWDDDNWPENRAIVGEMMASGEHVISAPYTNKKQPLRWVHQLLNERQEERNNLLEVRGVGFGFTMVSRTCLERMSAAARKYTDLPNPWKVANIFGQLYDPPTPGCTGEDEMLLSEDFSFCKRWREMGGRVVLYTGAGIIFHAGTHAWNAREMQGGVVG